MLTLPRRQPHRQIERGFTLVELMVVVAVMAVGASLAAPDLSRMVANYRIRGEAEALLGGLNFARAEAVRRNSAVAFTLQPASAGWEVSQVSPATALQNHSNAAATSVTLVSGSASTAVTFLSTGVLQAGSQLSQVTVASGLPGTNTRRINIFGGGLIRMCDPAQTAANDPRRC